MCENNADADALFRAGRLPEAKASYEEALRARPDDPRLLRRVGELTLYENRADDAVHHLGEALARSPRLKRRWPASAAVRARLAMAHYRTDRFPDAAREFSAAAGPMPVGPFRGLAGLASQLAAFGDDPPYRIDGPRSTRLEFVATDPLPTVELSVNGGPRALFFVDTGGAELVLDVRFAARAGAEMAGELNGEYGGGKRARTGLGRVGSIRAGELRIRDVPIHTLDLGALAQYFGIDVKGFLGTRLLMHFLTTIDYPGGGLTLHRDPTAARPERRIPFWLAESHLILVRGRLNDLPPTLFWVDTGLAGSGFLASERQLRAAGVPVDWSRARQGPGGGGMVTEAEVLIDTLTVGEADHAITREAVPGMVQEKAPSILGDRLGFEVGGLVSHAFFRPYALTIDFSNMCLVVE
jgi:Aspartyl protease